VESISTKLATNNDGLNNLQYNLGQDREMLCVIDHQKVRRIILKIFISKSLTPLSRDLIEKLMVDHLIKKFPAYVIMELEV
jgi:hypothetical protein